MEELRRLATFAQCREEPKLSFARLSIRGYEYKAQTRQIQCTGCGFTPSDLKSHCHPDTVDSGLEISNRWHRKLVNPFNKANCQQKIDILTADLKAHFPDGQNERLKQVIISMRERTSRWNSISNNSIRITSNSSLWRTINSANTGGRSFKRVSLRQTENYQPDTCPIQEESGIMIGGRRAKSDNYARLTDRIGSFDYCLGLDREQLDWLLRNKENLASAGFYYSDEPGGCVRCFFCDVGLRNWQPEHEPWIEHARWNQNCEYVQERKSRQFIADCQNTEMSSERCCPPREGLLDDQYINLTEN